MAGYSTGTNFLENSLRTASDSVYNSQMQEFTSSSYNFGIYLHITEPLPISATCNPRDSHFSSDHSNIQTFPFFPVAPSYGGQFERRGQFLNDATQHCAAGGLYMSAKDLAKFMTALDDPTFLPPEKREQMINMGNSDDLLGFDTAGGAIGGRAFWKNGVRNQDGVTSVAQVIRFQTGAHAVFVANSPIPKGVNVQRTLVNAYNAARN